MAQLALNVQLLAAAGFTELRFGTPSRQQITAIRKQTLLPDVVLHSMFNGHDEQAGSKGRVRRPVTAGLLMAPK
jgi:hypothetical protein